MEFSALVVDDDEEVRRLETRLLEERGAACTQAASAEEAWALLGRQEFDLALIDLRLPGASGLNLAKRILDAHRDTATLMVTGVDELGVAREALAAGVFGYVVKPFSANDLMIQVESAQVRRQRERQARSDQIAMEEVLRERTASLQQAIGFLSESQSCVEQLVARMAAAEGFRDQETREHVQRMSSYCALLVRGLDFTEDQCLRIRLASTLHDIGKIGVPDHILHKAGSLTPEEAKVLELHTEIGRRLLEGSTISLLQTAAVIAWTHHERWDGSGFPRALAGDTIPVEGQIAGIADTFDLLTSGQNGPCRTNEEVLTSLCDHAQLFDPSLLRVFAGLLPDLRDIQAQYPDPPGKQIFRRC